MNPEEELAFQQLATKMAQSELNVLKTNQAVTLFSGGNEADENLIKFQLDIEKSLLRIERLLRNQVPKRVGNNVIFASPTKTALCSLYKDEYGHTYVVSEEDNLIMKILENNKEIYNYDGFGKQVYFDNLAKKRKLRFIDYKSYDIVDKESILLNSDGVNQILNLLSWYVNKEVILSNYSDEQIDLIMFQFNEEVADFIYCNMEKFGLDTPEKKKHYSMIVMNIWNIVDATYRRAMGGLEREGLKTARVVTQSQNLNPQQMYPSLNKNKVNILNPRTWRA